MMLWYFATIALRKVNSVCRLMCSTSWIDKIIFLWSTCVKPISRFYYDIVLCCTCQGVFRYISIYKSLTAKWFLLISIRYLLFHTCWDGKITVGFYLFTSCSEVLHKRQTYYRSHVKSRLELKVCRRCSTEIFTFRTFIVYHLRKVQVAW